MSSNGDDECSTNYAQIYELVDKLAISMGGSNKMKPGREIVSKISHYISNSPTAFNKLLPYDSISLESKVRQHICKLSSLESATPHGLTTSFITNNLGIKLSSLNHGGIGLISNVNLFQKINEKLKNSRIDPYHHRAFLTFLLFMADSNIKNDHDKNKNINGSSNINPVYLRRQISDNSSSNKLDTRLLEVLSARSSSSDSGNKINTVRTSRGSSSDSVSTSTSNVSPSNNQIILPSPLGISVKEEKHNENDDILQNLIYAFTGIDGKYLQKDIELERFKLRTNCSAISREQAHILLYLSHLGYYHNLLQNFSNPSTGKTALGYMGQGFISAIKNELTKYYGMIAMLQEQLNQQRSSYQRNSYEYAKDRLTLTKLVVWAAEPLHRLKCLTIIAEKCKVQKGGELASTIYSFLGHGNPVVKSLAKELLLAVCHPLYQMLSHWMLEGVISDPHNEFFIKCINDVGPERLWKDKYSVCTDMLPTFISMDLANKILITGKSINFLREVCEDKRLMEGRDELLQCIKKDGEQIFSQVPDTKLHGIIESIFEKTSKSVLDKVKDDYKLEYHLQAQRRYLLLGQGDFICVLIELLKNELYKPAKDLRSSDLTSIMDSAIRSTNAHFDGADVYNNLHICCNNPCDGEIGWDIVSIYYKIDGPLAILFEDTNQIYQVLFRPLWRMKHMEHMLSTKIWKDQKCNDKIIRPIAKEISKILYGLHMLTSEIMHFIHQMEYYILFEVIECSWSMLTDDIKKARTLDDVLQAHMYFLTSVRKGTFRETEDKNSQELCQYMETVYECIQRLNIWQKKFYDIVLKELKARNKYTKDILISEGKGKFGTTTEKMLERDQERKIFEQHTSSYYKSLENIKTDYEKAVHCFLLLLHSNNDHNLQLFGIRLDFNEYYKKRDQRIAIPLTFEHMRMSGVVINNANKLSMGNRSMHLN